MYLTIDDVKKIKGICMVPGCIRNEYKNQKCRVCDSKKLKIRNE